MEEEVIKPQIALVFSGDFPEGNTKNARLKVLGKTLRQENWNVNFVSVYPSKYSISPGFTQAKSWDDFKITRLAFGRTYWNTLPARAIQIISGIAGVCLFALLFSRKYNVIYFYNPRFTDSLFGLMVCKLLRKKVVVDQTELFSSYNAKRRHRLEEKIIARYANILFCISENLYQYFSKLKPRNKLLRLPIMVDMNRFKELRKEEKYLVGYIGSFAHKDGIPDLVNGFYLARKEIPQLRLRLIGFNPNPDELMNQMDELGMKESVEITGNVSFDEVSWLLKECDTLVMNRRASSFASFGYPIKLGEYFACQRTVIMSKIDGFTSDFSHGSEAYIYEANNPQAMADALIYRYNHESESEAVAKRGYEYAKDNLDAKRNALFFVNAINDL